MCCGGKSRAARGPIADNIEYLEAIYNPPGGAEGSLYSIKKMDPKTHRPLLISPAAVSGDIVFVPVDDIIARPAIFISTCGEPFIRNGARLLDPCKDVIIAPAQVEDAPRSIDLGVPDIAVSWAETNDELKLKFGPLASKGIIEAFGHMTVGDLLAMDKDTLKAGLSERVFKIVERRRGDE